jgi:hypothetical protein
MTSRSSHQVWISSNDISHSLQCTQTNLSAGIGIGDIGENKKQIAASKDK